MRFGVVGSRHIEPVTRFLQYFYWPPLVVVILIAAAIEHVWLYIGHGAGASVQSALAAPEALLMALGIFILSACFHELGHAAALRYAGGKVRGMGLGMYLLYPVFYTDVTDSYRFGRWARVRTDLGGFYFNLIFALGLLAAYAVTQAEFLLLVVVLTNFDILRQSLPFVRMDGYWVLADLTGIPDLFTHLPGFVKARIPFRNRGSHATQFRLKGWVAVCFALYVLVTGPLLLAALFFMVRSVPRAVASGASAFHLFGQLFWAAVQAHEFLIAAGTAAQLAILALTLLGLVYMLARVAFDVGRGLWRWGRPSAERRAIAMVAGTSMAALVMSLWVPQGPWFGGSANTLAVRASMPAFADALSGIDMAPGAGMGEGRASGNVVANEPRPDGRMPSPSRLLTTQELPVADGAAPFGAASAEAETPVAGAVVATEPPPGASSGPAQASTVPAPASVAWIAPPATATVSDGTPAATSPAAEPSDRAIADATSEADSAPPASPGGSPPAVATPTEPPVVDAAATLTPPASGASVEVTLPRAQPAAAATPPAVRVEATVAAQVPVLGTAETSAAIGASPEAASVQVDLFPQSTAVPAAEPIGPVVDAAASAVEPVTAPLGGVLH
jgi:putative peptide zinc metalloprotease protein